MTAKEKAKELTTKYVDLTITTSGCAEKGKHCIVSNAMYKNSAKECALITIDEILKVSSFYNDAQAEVTYWQEVRQEIINL